MVQDYGGLYENPHEKLNFLQNELNGFKSNHKRCQNLADRQGNSAFPTLLVAGPPKATERIAINRGDVRSLSRSLLNSRKKTIR